MAIPSASLRGQLFEDPNSISAALPGCAAPRREHQEMAYPVLPQGYKATHHHAMYPAESYGFNGHQPLGRRASCQYPCDRNREHLPMPSGYAGADSPEDIMKHLGVKDPRALESLRDKIVALQMQNIELNLFLKKEEVRRKEAEAAVRREKEYVRKLQDSLQDLSSSTLVMDPLMYKQVADKYIASRKKPVRRTHTCNPHFSPSDLVCDSNTLQVTQNKGKSTSCPSSPLGSNQGLNRATPPPSLPPTSAPSTSGPSPPYAENPPRRRERGASFSALPNGAQTPKKAGTAPLDHRDYQSLIQSLNHLEVSSSPS